MYIKLFQINVIYKEQSIEGKLHDIKYMLHGVERSIFLLPRHILYAISYLKGFSEDAHL